VVVRSVEPLTPHLVRVRVAGEFAHWPEPGAAAHLKVFLPQDEGTAMRTYTVRHFDRERGEVVLDFVLHAGDGPAARWATQAKAGERLEVSGRSRSTFTPADGATQYLFAGDASALPAIATCLESLPASAHATVIGAVYEAADQLLFRTAAALEVHWLHAPSDGDFIEAVTRVDADRAWIACEATVMRKIRAALLERYDRGALATRGYWKRGESNHPDHDTGEDE
jgi:NADPH-dependent ferric siderophore reductase